ncbi:hypothetical protein J4Q44_G00328170, partial [Coregonus suidteri]
MRKETSLWPTSFPMRKRFAKRKRDVDEELDYMPDDLYDYKIAREYNWNVKNKASKGYEENYFFIFRDGDGVYYNELETRVRLSKRRAKAGAQSTTNAVLVCKHRDMNEKELEAQDARKAQLENHEPEDEEEDMDWVNCRTLVMRRRKAARARETTLTVTLTGRMRMESGSGAEDDEEEGAKRRRKAVVAAVRVVRRRSSWRMRWRSSVAMTTVMTMTMSPRMEQPRAAGRRAV